MPKIPHSLTRMLAGAMLVDVSTNARLSWFTQQDRRSHTHAGVGIEEDTDSQVQVVCSTSQWSVLGVAHIFSYT